jgi:hypothetical protein
MMVLAASALSIQSVSAQQVAARSDQGQPGNDLVNCVWANGSPMSADHCKQAKKEEQERLDNQARKEADRKHLEAMRDKEEADDQRRKKACGKDYETLRIGMTIDRYRECSQMGAAYVTETVSANGVVETYRDPMNYISVRNGRIVAITRR